MSGNKVVDELVKLANLKLKSPFLHKTAQNVLHLSFSSSKPIFVGNKEIAKANLIKSTPALEKSLGILHGSLNPDRREVALRARSGLQFLADEFQDVQELQELLKSSPVRCIEEYLKNSKEFTVEADTKHIDFQKIPKEHFWWWNYLGT